MIYHKLIISHELAPSLIIYSLFMLDFGDLRESSQKRELRSIKLSGTINEDITER